VVLLILNMLGRSSSSRSNLTISRSRMADMLAQLARNGPSKMRQRSAYDPEGVPGGARSTTLPPHINQLAQQNSGRAHGGRSRLRRLLSAAIVDSYKTARGVVLTLVFLPVLSDANIDRRRCLWSSFSFLRKRRCSQFADAAEYAKGPGRGGNRRPRCVRQVLGR
jgi:hypothetical protein